MVLRLPPPLHGCSCATCQASRAMRDRDRFYGGLLTILLLFCLLTVAAGAVALIL